MYGEEVINQRVMALFRRPGHAVLAAPNIDSHVFESQVVDDVGKLPPTLVVVSDFMAPSKFLPTLRRHILETDQALRAFKSGEPP